MDEQEGIVSNVLVDFHRDGELEGGQHDQTHYLRLARYLINELQSYGYKIVKED